MVGMLQILIKPSEVKLGIGLSLSYLLENAVCKDSL